MNCREWKKGYIKWQTADDARDGRSRTLPADLAGHLAGCAACRFRHETYESLRRKELWETAVPPALAGNVMRAVLERSMTPTYRRFPAPAIVIPAMAAALAAILLVTVPRLEREAATVTVKLALAAPHARSVTVAGDWNDWNPEADRLTDLNGDGFWEIELRLDRNREYRYQFIINGESWIPDPRAVLQVEDGFGGINSVLGI